MCGLKRMLLAIGFQNGMKPHTRINRATSMPFDPISYLNVNVETGEVGPRWFSVDNTIKNALYCGNILFLGFTSCLNENIGLGDETEKLLGGYLENMRKVYNDPAAGD